MRYAGLMATEPGHYTVTSADGSESGPLAYDAADALYQADAGAVMLAWY